MLVFYRAIWSIELYIEMSKDIENKNIPLQLSWNLLGKLI